MFVSCGPVKKRTEKYDIYGPFCHLWPTVSGFMAQFKFYRPIKGFAAHSRAIDTILISERII
ncbi:Uncharacterised protein [Serratia fonticola]|nr:Uncharacterised protein [Serratia fonticola]